MAGVVQIGNVGTARYPTESAAVKENFGAPPEYMAVLRIEEEGVRSEFTTPLSENITFALRSHWEPAFSKTSEETVAGAQELTSRAGATGQRIASAIGLAAKGASAFGYKVSNQLLTANVWQSTDSITFNVPFTFVAQTDPKKDVSDKIKALLKTTAPTKKNGLIIQAPGPTLVSAATGAQFTGRHIELQFGRFLLLNNCVITGVDVQVDMAMHSSGHPIKAVCNVEVISYFACVTTQDIEGMFNLTPYQPVLSFE